VAFTLESPEARDAMIQRLAERKVLALKSGPQAIRFRLPFVITGREVDEALGRIEESLPAAV
jgi:4-aminobutyrate aminotransferase-like enzyme